MESQPPPLNQRPTQDSFIYQAQLITNSSELSAAAQPIAFEETTRLLHRLFHKPASLRLLWLKRTLDIMLSAAAVVITLPIMAMAALVAWLELGCNPVFSQPRVGTNGNLFTMYKIRTMPPDSEYLSFVTLKDDARVSRAGRLMRQLNIDELPQLVNILKGEMSLIGARPLSLEESRFIINRLGYSPDFPGLIPRMRPGLIGLEQINRTQKHNYSERFALNSFYEAHWSHYLELGILFESMLRCRKLALIMLVSAAVVATGALAILHAAGWLAP